MFTSVAALADRGRDGLGWGTLVLGLLTMGHAKQMLTGLAAALLWAHAAGADEPAPVADWQDGYCYLHTEAWAGGVVNGPRDGWYPQGSRLTLQAGPFSGWRFERWQGDLLEPSRGENPLTLIMDRTLALAATFARVPVGSPDGLVLHYALDRDGAGLVRDESGMGNDGTAYGAAWTPDGRFGGARRFNGRSDFILAKDSPGLRLQQMTVAVWVLPARDPLAGDSAAILSKESPRAAAGYSLRQRGTNGLDFCILSGDARNHTACRVTLDAGRWHFIVGTFDGTTRRLYVNGELKAAADDAVSILHDYTPLYIGGTPGEELHPWEGLVDDVRIYNRALSAEQVARMYAGVPPLPGGATLTVAGSPAPHGASVPFGYGTHRVEAGGAIANAVTSDEAGEAGTRFVCTGWKGSGDVPASGNAPRVEFTVTTDSALTWQWKEQHRLDTGILLSSPAGSPQPPEVPGSVDIAAGWFDAGVSVTVTATASNGYSFVRWYGDVSPEQATNNPVTLSMDGARRAMAGFVRRLLPVSRVHFVSPAGNHLAPFASWADAAADIQSAVNAAAAGDVVWVTNGTYALSAEITITNGIALRSVGGARVTAVRADGRGRCFLVSAPGAIIDGFTVSGGRADEGGGISLAAPARVRNCVVTGNAATRGGGLYCAGGSLLQNCVVAGNSAEAGGGILADGFNRLENCTVSGNQAATSGGGFRGRWGNTVVNSILYYNAAPDGSNWLFDAASSGFLRLTNMISGAYNCADPAMPGRGNFSDEPGFADRGGNDLHLTAGSPCVDTGLNLPWMALARDVDRNPRMAGGRVDRGAYELAALSPTVLLRVEAVPEPHGRTWPHAFGVHSIPRGAGVTNTTVATEGGSQGVRFVCVGWLGTGSVAANGSDTSVVFTATADSTLTWQWKKQYWLDTGVSDGDGAPVDYANALGAVDVADGWFDAGASVTISAAPSSSNCHFIGWAGNLPPELLDANPLTIAMDRVRVVTARFLKDTDSDGMSDVAEQLVGTSWTDAQDIFAITRIEARVEGIEGIEIQWPTVAGKRYRIAVASDMLDDFVPVATNIPGTGGVGRYLDRSSTEQVSRFYRVEVEP